jgi:hypothetical protein
VVSWGVWLLAASAATAPAQPLSQATGAAEPSDSWTRIDGGAGTGCALDTQYSFFFRDGANTDRLLIYFQGGGACWDWVSCSGMFDSRVEPDEPRLFRGIFNTAEPRNPLPGYPSVFVPYCTADVHIGNASVTYGEGSRPVHHHGFRNVSAVLDWVAKRGFRPRTVVVTGTSAGSYGALFYTVPIARLFPKAHVVLIGDSGVPLLNRNADVLKKWGTESVARALWRTEPTAVTLLDAYRQTASIGTRVRMAMITSDQDSIQSAFYLISGSRDWRPATYSLLADVQAAVPAFRTFVVAGSDHGLVHQDAFYSYREGGVLLHDWVRRLVAGEAVENVRCPTCVR